MSSEDEYAIFFSTNGTHNAQNGKQIVGHKSFASCCFIPTQWLSPHKQVKESTCTPQNHRRRAQALQEEALGSLRAWWRHPIQSAAQAGDVAYMDSFFNIGPNKTPSNSPNIVSTPDVTPWWFDDQVAYSLWQPSFQTYSDGQGRARRTLVFNPKWQNLNSIKWLKIRNASSCVVAQATNQL